jgi:hypothetical protein
VQQQSWTGQRLGVATLPRKRRDFNVRIGIMETAVSEVKATLRLN